MIRRTLSVALLAASVVATSAVAADPGFQASAWTDYAKPKPIPLYAAACKVSEAKGCPEAWTRLLAAVDQSVLDAPSGGRAFRAIIGHGADDPNAYVVRLDIAADGRATVTTRFRGQPGQGASLSNAKVEVFDAALARSKFDKAEPSDIVHVCNDGGQRTVFEALVDDRYKFAVEECGDEAGLASALAVLQGG